MAGEEFAFLGKMSGEVARELEDGDRTWFYKSTNAYADARLKVCVEFVAFRHAERDGAVGKEHFACVGIDASWIGLKTRATRERMGNFHRQHGRYVAFTTCHDAFGVELCQRPATRVVDRGEKVEAQEGESLQLILLNQSFQVMVDAQSSRQSIADSFVWCFLHQWFIYLRFRNGTNGSEQFLHRYVDECDA